MATVMGLLGFFVWGVGFFALPVFYVPLEREFGWTRGQVTFTGGLVLLLYSAAMPLVGALIDRVGVRRVVLAGVALSGASIAWMAAGMNSLAGLYGMAAASGVACACVSLVTSQVLVTNWFAERRGIALGYLMAVTGLGGVVMAALAGVGIARLGWRQTALAGDALVWLVALPLAAFALRDRPEGEARSELAEAAAGVTGGLGAALQSARFYLLWGAVFLGMAVSNALMQNIAPHARDAGTSVEFSGYLTATLVAANIASRPLAGWLGDRASPRLALLVAYALVGSAAVALLCGGARALLVGAALLAGFGYGGTVIAIPTLTARLFGRQSLGKILGVVLFGFGMGGAAGVWLVGRMFTTTGGYGAAFVVLAVMAAVAIALTFLVRAKSRASSR